MLIPTRAVLLVAFLVVSSVLPALDIFVNGTHRRSYDMAELREAAYVKDSAPGGVGITADELAPVMVSAHRLQIQSVDAQQTIHDPNLAERLQHIWVLVGAAGSVSVIVGDTVTTNVRSLRIAGEPYAAVDQRRGRRHASDLDVWLGWEGITELKEEIDRFARMHDLRIAADEVPSAESKLLTLLRTGATVPDVVMVSARSIYPLVTARALQPIDTLAIPGVTERARAAFEMDDRDWAAPFYVDVQLMFMNPDLYPNGDAYRGTTTALRRGLERVLNDREDPKIHPAAWNAYSAYWLAPFQMGFGRESIVNADGTVTVDDPPTRAAFDYVLSLCDAGLLEIAERDVMISRFVAGKVGVMLSGSYTIPLLEDLGVPFEVSRYPFVKETRRWVSPMLDYKGFAVTRKTDAPVLARRLVQYLTGPGVQQRFGAQVTKIPVNEEARRTWRRENPYSAELIASEEIGTPVPVEPAYGIYKNTMWKISRLIYSEKLSVADALSEAQRTIDAHDRRAR